MFQDFQFCKQKLHDVPVYAPTLEGIWNLEEGTDASDDRLKEMLSLRENHSNMSLLQNLMFRPHGEDKSKPDLKQSK